MSQHDDICKAIDRGILRRGIEWEIQKQRAMAMCRGNAIQRRQARRKLTREFKELRAYFLSPEAIVTKKYGMNRC